MSDTNWGAYDEFIKQAEADNRIGKVALQVEKNEKKTTKDSSRQYHDVTLAITSAGGYKIRWFLPPTCPTPAEVKEARDSGQMNVFRGKTQTVQFFKCLDQYYGIKGVDGLQPGVSFIGLTQRGRERTDAMNNTKPGFIEVQAVLPKDTPLTHSYGTGFATTTPDGQAIPNF